MAGTPGEHQGRFVKELISVLIVLFRETIHARFERGRRVHLALISVWRDKPYGERIRYKALPGKGGKRRNDGSECLFKLVGIGTTPFQADLRSCIIACLSIDLDATGIASFVCLLDDNFGSESHVATSGTLFYHDRASGCI